ncbi:hypothetical protein ECG_09829 [Echinococcus granulosus]|nr:hypothetical protein ECG_09829 [Echinococcus granulosus]
MRIRTIMNSPRIVLLPLLLVGRILIQPLIQWRIAHLRTCLCHGQQVIGFGTLQERQSPSGRCLPTLYGKMDIQRMMLMSVSTSLFLIMNPVTCLQA